MSSASKSPSMGWTIQQASKEQRSFKSSLFSETISFAFADVRQQSLLTRVLNLANAVSVAEVTSTGHEIILSEHDRTQIIFPMAGQIRVATTSTDLSASVQQMLIFPPNKRRTVVAPTGAEPYKAFVLSVPSALLRARSEFLGFDLATASSPGSFELPIGPSPMTRVRDYLSQVHVEAEKGVLENYQSDYSARVSSAICDLLIELFQEIYRGGGCATGRLLRRHLRVAEQIIRDHYSSIVSISELACRVGVSPRALQISFRREYGVTPRYYLNRLRLEEAHRRLRSPKDSASVTSVAFDVGFSHLGRFALTYANRFGLSPSQTLRAARDYSAHC